MERATLGTEMITLLSGEERQINIYAVGYYEKMQIVKKNTKVVFDKGHQYKVLDEYEVVEEIIKISMKDVPLNELGYDIDKIYKKYFEEKAQEKKEETSTISPTDIS